MLQRRPDLSSARLTLADLLVAQGGEPQWREAQRLMDATGKDAAAGDAARRVQAMLLTRRGGRENLEKARQIFEELVLDPRKTVPADRLRLARLYEAGGKPRLARQQYLKLVESDKPNPADVAAFVDFLLRHDLFEEAGPWLTKLEGLAADDLGTVTLRARWLHGTGHDDKIEPLVERLAAKLSKPADNAGRQDAGMALAVGNLYRSVEQYPAAERSYRRLFALNPKRYELLAAVLAQQGRMGEAVDLCRQAAQSDRSASARVGPGDGLAGGGNAVGRRFPACRAPPGRGPGGAQRRPQPARGSRQLASRPAAARRRRGRLPQGFGAKAGGHQRIEQPGHFARGAAR